MFRLLFFIAVTLQALHGHAGNDNPTRFIAKGCILVERVELDHRRTMLITRHEQPEGLQCLIELVLLHLNAEEYGVEGRMQMEEGQVWCEQADSCTFMIGRRSKDNIISTLIFTCDSISPCTLSGYSQDYIMQYDPELRYGHVYHTPAGIRFGEVTPELLGRIAEGTAEKSDGDAGEPDVKQTLPKSEKP